MNKKSLCLFILVMIAALLSAFSVSAQSMPEDVLRTQVAATVMVELKQTLMADGQSEFKQALQAEGYHCIPIATATPAAPMMGQAVEAPMAVPTATLATVGNKASYDSQNPVDGTHVKAGQIFDITWYLLNTGSTTWTTDYSVRYFTGTNFTKPGKTRYQLNAEVAPNAVGACTVDAVAPSKKGEYQMAVVLGNENDENFYVMDITIIVD